ncbi:MAG: GTPase, partial [Acidimicrobiia bacterium]
MSEPVVAVVGRPNVGKSTLVNRLAQRRGRGSIVGKTPGLTRDRVEHPVSWRGKAFILADTGGVAEEALG